MSDFGNMLQVKTIQTVKSVMLMPFDLNLWNCFFYALVVAILLLPFIYDTRRETFIYQGKFFIYYSIISFASILLSFIFVFNAKNVRNCWYASDVLKGVSNIIGIKWELRGMNNIVKDGAIVIANHQSSLDLLGMFRFWRLMGKVTVIAKRELFYFWPFGLCAWLAGIVFINRSSTSEAYRILVETGKLTQRDKTKLFFFPEGTRNFRVNKTKKLLPFKKGAFKMAISCQVPVQPIVFSPYYFMDTEERYFGEGKMIVKALPAIPTTGLSEGDVDDLMEKARDAMTKAFEELFDEVVSILPEDHKMRNLKNSDHLHGGGDNMGERGLK